jgi:hypothetical protein
LKRPWIYLSLSAIALFTGVRLAYRWRQENWDRRVALAIDWGEYRDLAARSGASSKQLVQAARSQGRSKIF